MNALDFAIYALALPGHAALCIAGINRIQAEPVSHRFLKLISWPARFAALLGPLFVVLAILFPDRSPNLALVQRPLDASYPWLWAVYVGVCVVVALWLLPRWLLWSVRHQREQLTDHLSSQRHNLSFTARGHRPGWKMRLLSRLPGNQIYQLDITEKSLPLPRLDPELDGLSIAHLSDLHLTGEISERYFDEVVRRTNELQSDLIVISGDVVDKLRCLDWIPRTLAHLRAKHGVYYVLGNHDIRTDQRAIARALDNVGFISLSGRWHALEINGRAVLLAGNELPWIRPAADPNEYPVDEVGDDESRPLRICVAHSPDQYAWAQRYGFDLMLAGHTHGGQIRFPLVGAIVAPSRFGPRYASGTYYEGATVMHVSRGISGDMPIRWNCPPELASLTLRSRIRPEWVNEAATVTAAD